MTVLASALGATFEPRRVTVTARMALAYAAGIGCDDERYVDDARPDGLIAVSPLCVSLEWLIAGDAEAQAVLGLTPAERLRAVHVGQDTEFHQPLIAGDTVSVSGRVESIHPTRSGARVTTCFQVMRIADQGLITTSRCDAIYRDVEIDAPELVGQAMVEKDVEQTQRPVQAPSPDHFVDSLELPIARSFPHVYSECASIWNPIHTERRIALAAGLPDIIVHGTALWALAWKELSTRHGDLARLSGRFAAMAIPGRPVTLRSGLPDRQTGVIGFRLDNDRGEPVIKAGRATLARPESD